MREIKFRGKRLDNGGWVVGNLIIAENGAPYIFPPEICEVDGHHLRQGDDVPLRVDPATVGQFTGLKDKNGREIYEGDIVKVDWMNDLYAVIYDCGSFLISAIRTIRHDLFAVARGANVIGNLHDNPEMLKK